MKEKQNHFATTRDKLVPTHVDRSAELAISPDVDELQLFDLIGNYLKDLKSIKRPRISNVELLDGVDRASRNMVGCIELAEFAL